MKITSAALVWLAGVAGAFGQSSPTRDDKIITPTFVPAPKRATSEALPVRFAEPTPAPQQPGKTSPTAANGRMPEKGRTDYEEESIGQAELPGPQAQFTRISEDSFYSKIALERRRMSLPPAIFPAEQILTKAAYKPRNFPATAEMVEPGFLLHRRLLFEQPNFERTGWDLGVVQPVVCLGVFYYDMALLPYHYWSELSDRSEGSPGKCWPGDQAPLRVPIERFSVTGAIGEAGVLIGGAYLFP